MAAHINNWNDLQKYGINALTGEACAYSMRLLCDLNEDGVERIREAFGMQIVLNPQVQFSANWNTRVGEKPAVASIMLFYEILPVLSRFILFNVEKCEFVVHADDGSSVGYTSEDIDKYGLTRSKLDQLYGGRIYRNHRNPEASVGSRNVHQATGRSE